jgi:hypothetical protein
MTSQDDFLNNLTSLQTWFTQVTYLTFVEVLKSWAMWLKRQHIRDVFETCRIRTSFKTRQLRLESSSLISLFQHKIAGEYLQIK